MKIVVLDDYQDVVKNLKCFSLLSAHDVQVLTTTYSNREELVEKLADVEALVLIRERTEINASLLSKLPTLKLISQTGKVSNHINLVACAKHHVLVAEGVGSPIAPAELCWALILSASRHIPQYAMNLSNGIWQSSKTLGLGRSLNGQTLGIWGYGNIGRRIAQFGKAFGMNVVVWGSEASRMKAKEDGFSAAQSKLAFFSSCDILSLHLKLNDATKNCVTKFDLEVMKPDSLFVNISRAELVQSNALYEVLKQNPTKRAAIDVFNNEPATIENEPLLSLPNALCTPHLGYVEQNNYELYFRIAFENIVAYAQGKPQNVVNVP